LSPVWHGIGGEVLIELIPAIDLRGGRCVRLYQGDFRQETVYSEDPAEVALHWQSLGAPRLHLVDLDGAVEGEPVNLGVVVEIARRVRIPLQLGGGIRKISVVGKLLRVGLERVVLGTVAVEEPHLVAEACQRFGEAIIVGIDAREGYVAIRGWQTETRLKAMEFVGKLSGLGVRRVIFTDIDRDGTLTEPNYEAIDELTAKTGMSVIASGGVSSIAQLKRLARLRVEGAIIGKALYAGLLDFEEAVKELGQQKSPEGTQLAD
jgi:phosphoribosylformimino-5-aminoimidazole carboxamide ribotide isomerase